MRLFYFLKIIREIFFISGRHLFLHEGFCGTKQKNPFWHSFLCIGYNLPMKKNQTQPDFRQLCLPEQNHIVNFISLLFFFYFTASIGGYLWEVLIFFWKDGVFRNRGFLYGPWLPVYGVGAVLFYLLCFKMKRHPIRVFLLTALIGSGLELLIGCLLDVLWGLRYWDYSDYPYHLFGYVCLYSALGFGLAGMLWVCLLSPFLKMLWLKCSKTFRCSFNTLLILLLLLDVSAALIFPNSGTGITFSR